MAPLIPMFAPRVSPAAIERVLETLRAGWLSEGNQVRGFEEEFVKRFQVPHALALNSGTSALHLAVLGAGIGPGDEVITTAQTFVATAMSVLYAGGTPVFADLQENSPNIDPMDVKRRITERTRAILVVHYGGMPCDMDEINLLADSYRLSVIEDCAHALGATYRGKPVGALGRFGCFSFQAIKQLTTGDGGMLVASRPADHQTAYRRRWFGIDRARRKPNELGQPEWNISEIGYKYHMNDLGAAMGLAHLESFGDAQARRRTLDQLYRRELANVPGLTLLNAPSDRESGCWLFTVLADRRLDFIRAVKSRGVEASVWHQRIDRHALLGGPREDLPRQASFDDRQVSVPLRDTLTDEEVEAVLRAVKAGW